VQVHHGKCCGIDVIVKEYMAWNEETEPQASEGSTASGEPNKATQQVQVCAPNNPWAPRVPCQGFEIASMSSEHDTELFHRVRVQSLEAATQERCNCLQEALLKEAGFMVKFTHPSLVHLCGVCLDPPLLVMEYYHNGSMWSMLEHARDAVVHQRTNKVRSAGRLAALFNSTS